MRRVPRAGQNHCTLPVGLFMNGPESDHRRSEGVDQRRGSTRMEEGRLSAPAPSWTPPVEPWVCCRSSAIIHYLAEQLSPATIYNLPPEPNVYPPARGRRPSGGTGDRVFRWVGR